MFTGLIQQVCAVKTLLRSGDTAVLTADLGQLTDQVKTGDSIAINGVCLTVSKLTGPMATFDLSAETLTKTTLGKLSPDSKVNVELALRADERFGGHFVLGHVDGIVTIKQIAKKANFATFAFAAPKELLDQMIPKGSVAVDGISLTIAELTADAFTVAVIPQTLKQTILGEAQINQKTNVEIDIITKTVRRCLEKHIPPKGNLTIEGLRQQGY
ncbi:MAG: riboflavin synthase [Sedimentisphaerales bacterium]|jgi:riboflavin synthase